MAMRPIESIGRRAQARSTVPTIGSRRASAASTAVQEREVRLRTLPHSFVEMAHGARRRRKTLDNAVPGDFGGIGIDTSSLLAVEREAQGHARSLSEIALDLHAAAVKRDQ